MWLLVMSICIVLLTEAVEEYLRSTRIPLAMGLLVGSLALEVPLNTLSLTNHHRKGWSGVVPECQLSIRSQVQVRLGSQPARDNAECLTAAATLNAY